MLVSDTVPPHRSSAYWIRYSLQITSVFVPKQWMDSGVSRSPSLYVAYVPWLKIEGRCVNSGEEHFAASRDMELVY
jgi:hypothetical protein